jgi:fumarate reductase subunit C
MTTIETILNVLDAMFGLWVLVSLLLPGQNFIKDLAIPMLIIITVINLLGGYPETRDSIITIIGKMFRS